MTAAERFAWPTCSGCKADIIGSGPGEEPWSIKVRDPAGREHEGGAFCLPCMLELAKRGVILHPVGRR